MMHIARTNISESCPVCGVDKYDYCVKKEPHISEQQQELPLKQLSAGSIDLRLKAIKIEVATLEYQITAAVRRLRELRDHHPLVVALTSAVKATAKAAKRR